VRHRNKPPHKIRELREVTLSILAGRDRETRFRFSFHPLAGIIAASGKADVYQLVPLCELWEPFGKRLSFGDSVFMVVTGYLDESVDEEWFTLGSLFTTGIKWTWLEVDWIRCLERWNKRLSSEGRPQISRFHASDCWTRNEEYEGWTYSERDAFLAELRDIIGDTDGVHSVSLSLKPAELAEVFGIKRPKRVVRGAYQVLLQYLMLELGATIDQNAPNSGVTLPLIHDRTKHYDEIIQKSFFELKDDRGFRYSQYFTTIAPMCWQQCVALQPADMIAYESRKEVGKVSAGNVLGGELKKIIELPSFGGSARYFRRENLVELKAVLEQIDYKLTSL
jgi:hypothetical protein